MGIATIKLMLLYSKSVATALKELDTTSSGLSPSIARERLLAVGRNEINIKTSALLHRLLEPFSNIFIVVLLIAVIISFLQGAVLDGFIIITIIFISAIIFYVQSFSTERLLKTLSKNYRLPVDCIRDGRHVTIDAALLVPGDIILLSEGDKIPADGRLIETDQLRVDESQLTGESLPISKQLEPVSESSEVYERSNMLYHGSFIISGSAKVVVSATGNDTEFGRIAALSTGVDTSSPIQQKIDTLLSRIIMVVALLALIAFGLSIYRGIDVSESLRFVIALSVSAIPESLPIAISVILVLAMRRVAKKNALVRSMRAIETIGAITTIATDKTGTLTKNKLKVQSTWAFHVTPPSFTHSLAQAINYRDAHTVDPLDSCLHAHVGSEALAAKAARPARAFPFDQTHSMSGNIWHHAGQYELALKGAPESVLSYCNVSDSERESIEIKLHKETAQGKRVIALAKAKLNENYETLDELIKLIDPKAPDLEFIGFISVADELRPEARTAIASATKAGVSVRMITGDHVETAYAIGQQLGMITDRNQVFDSRRMHTMTDDELLEIVSHVRIFARVIPEDKFRLLSLLKRRNITAMTGDGVNDVPALSNAHVGLAMGSGSHIARDASDIILLDDNFKSIVDAMREGRTVLANIRRMLFYLLSTNAGEVLTMIGSLVMGMPVPLLPVQILWVNLVTDTCMVIPIGLEPGEKRIMFSKPRSAAAPILSKFMISRIVLLATTMAVVILSIYAIFSQRYGHAYGQTIAFSSLVVIQWASAFCARSDYESLWKRIRVISPTFYIGLSIAVILHVLTLFGPIGPLLHITPVAIGDLFITGLIAFIAPIIVMEFHKYIGRRFFNKGHKDSEVAVPA